MSPRWRANPGPDEAAARTHLGARPDGISAFARLLHWFGAGYLQRRGSGRRPSRGACRSGFERGCRMLFHRTLPQRAVPVTDRSDPAVMQRVRHGFAAAGRVCVCGHRARSCALGDSARCVDQFSGDGGLADRLRRLAQSALPCISDSVSGCRRRGLRDCQRRGGAARTGLFRGGLSFRDAAKGFRGRRRRQSGRPDRRPGADCRQTGRQTHCSRHGRNAPSPSCGCSDGGKTARDHGRGSRQRL